MPSDRVSALNNLYNNHYLLCELLRLFHSEIKEQRDGLLLSYPAIPLILATPSRKSLKNAKSTSTLITFCNNEDNIYGLNDVIKSLKPSINAAIQHGVDAGNFYITSDLSVRLTSSYGLEANLTKDLVKVVKNLARILNPHEIPTVFQMLGVKKL